MCARGAALDAIKAAFLRCVFAGSNQISPNFIRLLPKFLSSAAGPTTGGPELEFPAALSNGIISIRRKNWTI